MNNVVETKIKKIYLLDNKNDIYQKKSLEYLKNRVVKSVLDTYKGESIEEKELSKFISYLTRFVKQNNSKNDINYRIASIYNYIISKYSDYLEINQIIQD